MNGIRKGFALLSICVTFGCRERHEPSPTTDRIVDAMVERVRRAHLDPAPARSMIRDSLRVKSSPSEVVPGVVYHAATFRPPGMFDGEFSLIFGEREGELRQLNNLQDWNRLVGGTHWSPASGQDAIGVCAEVLRLLGPGSASTPRAVVYEGGETLRTAVLLMPDSAIRIVADSIAAPTAARKGEDWEVRLWAIEAGRTAEYSCRLNLDRRLLRNETAVSLSEIRTIQPGQLAND